MGGPVEDKFSYRDVETATAKSDSRAGPGGTEASDREVLNGLLHAAEDLSWAPELDAMLHKVAERLRQQIDYDTFAVLLLGPLGQELRVRFAVGYPAEVIEHWRFGLGQGLVGTVAQTGQPLRVGDVRHDARYINAVADVHSEMAIPLVVKNRTIGVLDVQSHYLNHFHDGHQRMLTLLAGHLANAIENARLYENLREQARTLSLLYEVSRELTAILDREELLGRIAQAVKRLVDYQLFSVMLWNEETQRLEHIFLLRHGERIMEASSLPLGHGICGTAAALRQLIRVPNVHVDPRYVRCAHETDVRSEVAVPLVFKDRLVGVLELESTEYNAFSEQHEQILSTLASYIAIALENARLYEKVREDEHRLESDLATAREIQRSLLPDAAPRVPGLEIAFFYAPARHLGGDVYDVLPYGEGRVAVAVGDVAGKGAAAALYGSLAIGILRGHVVEHPCEPAEMLEQMNGHLLHPRTDSRYVALAFSVYDSRSRTLTLANAGFPRPRLLRRGLVEEIAVEGVPLGLLPESRYEQKKLALQVGDTIIFYSDGIHECVNAEGEEFGANRLHALLVELARSSAQQIADSILRATDQYAARSSSLADDRTVVVLRVTAD